MATQAFNAFQAALPAASALASTDTVVGLQGAASKKITIAQLAAAIQPAIGREITASANAAMTDLGTVILANHATVAIVVTIPSDASAGWDNTKTNFLSLYRKGASAVSFAAGAGVTLRQPSTFSAPAQYDAVGAIQVGANEWALVPAASAESGATEPYILGLGGAPCGIAQTGTVGGSPNNTLTLGTAMPTTYGQGIWLYFPANAVASGAGAGFYWCVMSSTTAGLVYSNTRLSTDTLAVPGSPAAAAGYGSATAYTGSTSAVEMVKCTLAANALGLYGGVRSTAIFTGTSGTSNRTITIKLGGSNIAAPTFNSTHLESACAVTTYNVGSAAKQTTPAASLSDGGGGATTGVTRTTVDTSVASNLTINATLGNAADNCVLEGWSFVVYPAVAVA